jgi:hypothetical protein
MSAAEVGFKAFIATLVPDAGWLAFNAPAPPLVDMLKYYLPMLPVRLNLGVAPFVPDKMIEVGRNKGVSPRNKTIHIGQEVSAKVLNELLLAVQDFLYVMDYYAGHQWAWDHVTKDTREAMLTEVEVRKRGEADRQKATAHRGI